MPRRQLPLEESPAWDVYSELLSYVDTAQVIPNEHAFYEFVFRFKGYGLTIDQYRYACRRLREEGYIEIDNLTGAIKIIERRIVDPLTIPKPSDPD